MKTDAYLNLCLEQAELSPLGHRHGCIVVKGGKVIGKGFNDYRPGYEGGALKTGVLSSKSFALDKPKLKGKEDKEDGFKPFEGMFDGKYRPNYVLSMHSEMMAINSALASSSTLAATTLSYIKPPFTPSRDSKRKRQLRREILAAYMQSATVAGAVGRQVQQCTGEGPGAGWRFEPGTYQCLASTTRPSESESLLSSRREAEAQTETAETTTAAATTTRGRLSTRLLRCEL